VSAGKQKRNASWPGAGTAPLAGDPQPGAQNLRAIVEYEIIPRLMLAHSEGSEMPVPGDSADFQINDDTVRYFTELTLTRDAEVLSAFVAGLVERNFSLEDVYMELVVPAARLLGAFWNEDRVSYTDVTIGLGRLQQLIRSIGWQVPPGHAIPEGSSSALFATTPGENHMLGLIIIEDQFRRAGWRTWLETSAEEHELVETVAHHWFDVVGFTLSSPEKRRRLKSVITAVRQASRNRGIFVLVGGKPFQDNDRLLEEVGADASAANGTEALTLMRDTVCQP
jgi:methanogenic corrinoid protein MtbC1